MRQPRALSKKGVSLSKFPFVYNDEFGYQLQFTDTLGMYFVYKPYLVKEAERPKTTKQMLM